MANLYFRKEIAVLPATLTANTIYAVRRSTGFDLYITDSLGIVAHKINNTDDPLKSPVFTYSSGLLTGITYSDGSTKIFTYVSGQLSQIDLIKGTTTTRKTFSYTGDQLDSITETTF
jgi:hypothetical protein